MDWFATLPYAFILSSLLIGHRYSRHAVAIAGGALLLWQAQLLDDFTAFTPEIIFSTGIIVINFGFLAYHLWLNLMPLSKQEKQLYVNYFGEFSRGNFKKLMAIAKIEDKAGGATLVQQGKHMDKILLIMDGKAAVVVNNEKIAELIEGDFVGEFSFMSGHCASATVKAQVLTRFIVWDQENLRNYLWKNGSLLIQFHKAMKKQITTKLVDHERDVEEPPLKRAS